MAGPKANWFKKGYDPKRRLEERPGANRIHNHRGNGLPSLTYQSWLSMKQRCLNKKRHNYYLYGGRGITICEQWLHSFTTFLADMGVRPDGTTLDRINSDGNYEPANCRWSTPTEQARNRRNSVK